MTDEIDFFLVSVLLRIVFGTCMYYSSYCICKWVKGRIVKDITVLHEE